MQKNTTPAESKPAVAPGADKTRVQEVLERIRPALQADGGDVELVDVSDGTVQVKLVGHCGSCPMSIMTLKHGIERLLKQEVPEVKQVVQV